MSSKAASQECWNSASLTRPRGRSAYRAVARSGYSLRKWSREGARIANIVIYSPLTIRHSLSEMKLDILTALNAERAARRAAIVISNVETGKQRFVKAGEIGRDPLRAALSEHLRTGKSGMAETAEGRVFLTVY